MMRSQEGPEQGSNPAADHRLWERCRMMDAAEDEAARFLDLAAFADGSLDPEEQERVEAMLAPDPEAAGDVRAARELAGAAPTSAGLEQVIARAAALAPVTGKVVPFAPRRGGRLVSVLAQWGSIAAAIVLAGWLGFSMGSDASLALRDRPPNDIGLFPEFFDPATGLLRDLGEGLRT